MKYIVSQVNSTVFHLKTDRLFLRPPVMDDVDGLWPFVSDVRLTTYLAWAPHSNAEETKKMLDSLVGSQAMGTAYHWVVQKDGLPIGLISLIDVKRTHRSWILNRAELAYWIGLPFQNKGYAFEAANAVMQFANDVLQLHKIRVYHAKGNINSQNVINRLGFRFIGEEQHAFQKEGVWHDLFYYEKLININ